MLDAAKREIRDLPIIQDYVANGRPFICWAHVLGRCHFGDACTFAGGHPPQRAIPDQFAKEVVDLLSGGIEALIAERTNRRAGGGSPVKKQKGGEE